MNKDWKGKNKIEISSVWLWVILKFYLKFSFMVEKELLPLT